MACFARWQLYCLIVEIHELIQRIITESEVRTQAATFCTEIATERDEQRSNGPEISEVQDLQNLQRVVRQWLIDNRWDGPLRMNEKIRHKTLSGIREVVMELKGNLTR